MLHALPEAGGGKEHAILTMGDLSTDEPVLVRIHSECLTGDAFGSLRCDCGPQLHAAMERIAAEGRGVLVYLRQEGRGIGLTNKIRAYRLQDRGADTVSANLALGLPADLRTYEQAARALALLGVRRIRLMTNNPAKIDALRSLEIDVAGRVPLRIKANRENAFYLATKKLRMGHLIED